MENLNSNPGGDSKTKSKTANSSNTVETVNPDSKYVGSYLRWLGDRLEEERSEICHRGRPPPHHSDTLTHKKVARDLAWVGDQLEKRQDNPLKTLDDFVGDFSPCCVVIFGIFCYVVVSGIRRIR